MAKPRTAPDEEMPLQPDVMPGTQLRAARESQGMTAQDVAARLHLDTRTIESLEADAYRELPNEAYIRGYIRTYARLVNVDASPLLATYDRHAEHIPTLTPFASMPEPQARASDFPVKAVTYLVVATLVALLVLWSWQTHNLSSLVTFAVPKWGQDGSAAVAAKSAQPAVPAAKPPASTGPQPPQINYTYPVIDNSAGPAPEAETSSPASASDTQAASAPAAADNVQASAAPAPGNAAGNAAAAPAGDTASSQPGPAQTSAVAAASPGGSDTAMAVPAPVASDGQGLVLEVNDADSWIGIDDGAGKKLYFNLARKGSRISVQGQLPYEVRIGRAAAVTILYQNKPLDVSAYTHQGVAHFQLTADGLAAP